MQTKSHMFMPTETISGAIKKYNRHDVTKEEIDMLMEVFRQLNTSDNPRPGSVKLIPVLDRHN